MKWFARIMIGIGVICASGMAVASDVLREHPGYADVDFPGMVGEAPSSVEVFIEKPLLRVLMGAATEMNEDVAELISQIDLIQVKVYEDLTQEWAEFQEKLNGAVAGLKENGWSQVVRVPEDKETVDVLMKTDGELIVGLTVIVAEEDERVFVNLVGMIEPEVFGKLLAKLGPGVLEGDIDLGDLGQALGFSSQAVYTHESKEVEVEEIEIHPPEMELSREQLEPLVGTYMIQSGEEAGSSIHIEIGDEGKLWGWLENEPKSRMHAINEDTFVVPAIDAAVEFERNDDGAVESLTVKIDNETISANKV